MDEGTLDGTLAEAFGEFLARRRPACRAIGLHLDHLLAANGAAVVFMRQRPGTAHLSSMAGRRQPRIDMTLIERIAPAAGRLAHALALLHGGAVEASVANAAHAHERNVPRYREMAQRALTPRIATTTEAMAHYVGIAHHGMVIRKQHFRRPDIHRLVDDALDAFDHGHLPRPAGPAA